ncbi:protein Sur7p [[Candida] railenensis]|uniref:Protein Sur7p n=1 Tax=[Candida] railenensis TaxID=45579 RepID=A0A9P0QVY6_9ASCO|nr:protein Sur7p [[Candida] railenensis]
MKLLLAANFFTSLAAFVLLIFALLVGVSEKSPFGELYWSQVSVSGSSGSSGGTRWTNFGVCSFANGKNVNCTSLKFPYPYNTQYNYPNGIGVIDNSELRSKESQMKAMSRAAPILLAIGLIFAFFSLLCVLLACALPVRFIIGFSNFIVFLGFIVTAAGASLLTYVHIFSVTTIKNDGVSTSTGSKAFGLLWASVAAYLISIVLFSVTWIRRKTHKGYQKTGGDDRSDSHSEKTSKYSDGK